MTRDEYVKRYFKAYPERRKALDRVSWAKRNGWIVPEPCEICRADATLVTVHHQDYSKPLEVNWLCPSCHRRVHYAVREIFRTCGLIKKFMSELKFI